jgi:hypothetical protein
LGNVFILPKIMTAAIFYLHIIYGQDHWSVTASSSILDNENLAASGPDPNAKARKFATPDKVLFLSRFELVH